MGECSSCGNEKELTKHGTCWKCHVGGIQASGGCKTCGKNPDTYRVEKTITSSVKTIGTRPA